MKRTDALVVVLVTLALPIATTAAASEPLTSPLSAEGGQMPAPPAPGPAHELLKSDAGDWDAVVETFGVPGGPVTSKGAEHSELACGGLCLVTAFKGELMPGVVFEGRGLMTYDPAQKKYIGSWTDSFSTGLSRTEGTFDPATKTFNGLMEGPGMTGEVVKMRSSVDYSKPDTRVFTAYGPGPDGKEAMAMRSTYTRRK